MRKVTWGEALFGKKEHKTQMRRVKQGEKEMKYCKNCKYKFFYLGYHLACTKKAIFLKSILPRICADYKRKWWKFWVAK